MWRVLLRDRQIPLLAVLLAVSLGGLYATRPRLRLLPPTPPPRLRVRPPAAGHGALRLRWRAVPGAAHYRVTFLQDTLDTAAVRTVSVPRLDLPGPPAGARLWWVEARDDRGRLLAWSGPRELGAP